MYTTDNRDANGSGTTVAPERGAEREEGQQPTETSTAPLPGGPYRAYYSYQGPQPTANPPAYPLPVPARSRPPGLRETNPALWTVLVILGVITVAGLTILVVAMLFAANFFGRIATTPVGPTETESRSVQLGAATSAQVELKMGAGDISVTTVTSGGADLMNADFTYNVANWKPEVAYTVNAGSNTGSLIVEQPDSSSFPVGNPVNSWDVRLSESVPIDLRVNVGAGNTDLKLANVDLTRLEVIAGAGNTIVDLLGVRAQDVDVRIVNSVGNATVYIPTNVGAKVSVSHGLGNVTADGLERSGDTYTNAAYGNSSQTMNIYLEVATGNIVLQSK